MTILKKVFPPINEPTLETADQISKTIVTSPEVVKDGSLSIAGVDGSTASDSVFLSHDFLAQKFTERHASTIRYIAKKAAWYKFDGTVWKADDTVLAFDLARKISREYAKTLQPDDGKDLSKASTIASVERIARSARETSATLDQWDTDPWLLNTPGGVVDLKTGATSQHDPAHYMTQITSVTPENIATPIWDAFLNEAQPDNEIQDYLYRRAGCCLTGITEDQAFFVDWGAGGNGKGVFHTVIREILGSYTITAPIDIIIERKNDHHTTELARLHNARLVQMTESQSNRKWNEALLKKFSGQDTITARFMRQDDFEYLPKFKLCIYTNHMPNLRNVDDAIRRRFQLVGWNCNKGKISPDKKLGEKLRAEYPGILYKLIYSGCVEWQKTGLNPPKCVLDTTNEYLKSQDLVVRWLEECDTSDKTYFVKNRPLWDSFVEFCDALREYPGKMTGFTQKLANDLNYKRGGKDDREGFLGIKPPPAWDAPRKLERTNHPDDEIEISI